MPLRIVNHKGRGHQQHEEQTDRPGSAPLAPPDLPSDQALRGILFLPEVLPLIIIVSPAQQVVTQDLISVLQIAEVFGGVRVMGIGVGVAGKTQPSKSLLDVMRTCQVINPKNLVIILVIRDQIQNAGKKLQPLPKKLDRDLG